LWSIIDEQTVFSASPYLEVTRQHVVTDSGISVPDYYQVVMPDFAMACAVTTGGEILTLWQYKHGARRFGLTFPAGLFGSEDPDAAMRRELLEETGYAGGTVTAIGSYAVAGNQGCGHGHFFLITDCERVAGPQSGDLETMELRLMSAEAIDRACRDGQFILLSDLALWGLARPLLAAR
jgi:ADP-ribose pyrophosphatase